MTESQPNAFSTFSARIHASHRLNVRLLRDAFLAVAEPNLNQRFGNHFGFQMRAAEPPHRVPCSALALKAVPTENSVHISTSILAARLSRISSMHTGSLVGKHIGI
jgi:hypothetical protein